jgi:4,5-DOPA dioxygenase extradiol
VLKLAGHKDYPAAVPTPDHFIPLLYLAGMAAEEGRALDPLVRGYAMGSISMTCYGHDAAVRLQDQEAEGAATLPEGVPADQSNI